MRMEETEVHSSCSATVQLTRCLEETPKGEKQPQFIPTAWIRSSHRLYPKWSLCSVSNWHWLINVDAWVIRLGELSCISEAILTQVGSTQPSLCTTIYLSNVKNKKPYEHMCTWWLYGGISLEVNSHKPRINPCHSYNSFPSKPHRIPPGCGDQKWLPSSPDGVFLALRSPFQRIIIVNVTELLHNVLWLATWNLKWL